MRLAFQLQLTHASPLPLHVLATGDGSEVSCLLHRTFPEHLQQASSGVAASGEQEDVTLCSGCVSACLQGQEEQGAQPGRDQGFRFGVCSSLVWEPQKL